MELVDDGATAPDYSLAGADPRMVVLVVHPQVTLDCSAELAAASPLERPAVAPVVRVAERIIRDVRRHRPIIPRRMRADPRQQIPPIRIAIAKRMRRHIAVVESAVEGGEPGEIRVDRAQDAAVGLLVDSGADVAEGVGGGLSAFAMYRQSHRFSKLG